MNTTDCAWCGTGEGICDSHMQALFAESAELAATGQYQAHDGENAQPKIEQLQESETEHGAAA